MRPRDWFSVGVRLFGLWAIYRGFLYLLAYVADRLDLMSRSVLARELDATQSHTGYYIMVAMGQLAFGFVLIYGAERITRWAFREPSPHADGDTEIGDED